MDVLTTLWVAQVLFYTIHSCVKIAYSQYNVQAIEINPSPILSYIDGDSTYQQLFNPSWIIQSSTINNPGLIIRTQNCTAIPGQQCVFCSGYGNNNASRMTFTTCNVITGICQTGINSTNVVFEPSSNFDIFGTEDPRVAYNKWDQYYYMLYTSYGNVCILYSVHLICLSFITSFNLNL